MANNYHYIIAGLPELFLSSENKGFQYEQFRAPIVEQLSQKDLRLVELLEEGLNPDNLSEEFYAKALKQRLSTFIRFYYFMDLRIRNRVVEYVKAEQSASDQAGGAAQAGGNAAKAVGSAAQAGGMNQESSSTDGEKEMLSDGVAIPEGLVMPEGEGLSEEFDAQLNAVFGMGNIIERELALDKLKWDEINRFLTFEYFTLNNILATLVKASILERWSVLDRAAGMELFRKFVDEVRGTFKGINNKENIN